MLIPILALSATIELARERPDAAIGLAREILTADAPDYRLRELAVTVRVLTRCGALEDAEAQMQGLMPTAPRHRAVLTSARAEMAEARGDLAGGAALHREAAEVWSRFGDVVEREAAGASVQRDAVASIALISSSRCAGPLITWPS